MSLSMLLPLLTAQAAPAAVAMRVAWRTNRDRFDMTNALVGTTDRVPAGRRMPESVTAAYMACWIAITDSSRIQRINYGALNFIDKDNTNFVWEAFTFGGVQGVRFRTARTINPNDFASEDWSAVLT